MINIRTYAGLFLAGLILGITLTIHFMSIGSNKLPKPNRLATPAVLAKNVSQMEIAGKKQLDSLSHASQLLTQQLKSTTVQLAAVKQKNKQLQTQIYNLIDHMDTAGGSDSTENRVDTDSLKTSVVS